MLTLIDFVQTRKTNDKNDDAESYTQWLINNQTALVIDQLDDLKYKLRNLTDNPELKDFINKMLSHMGENHNLLNEIENETSKIETIDDKLDFLIESLNKKESSVMKKGQVSVCVEVLNILSGGLKGAGFKTIMNHPVNPDNGSLMFVWLTGSQSPEMMLVDYVGSIKSNRISVVLNKNTSISVKCYDSNSDEYVLTSPVLPIQSQLIVFVIWKQNNIQFWINDNLIGNINMNSGFDFIGPLFLIGIDIEGKLRADSLRWDPKNKVDSNSGYNLMRNGIWHGSNFETMLVLSQILNKSQIKKFVEDPFLLFRNPNRLPNA